MIIKEAVRCFCDRLLLGTLPEGKSAKEACLHFALSIAQEELLKLFMLSIIETNWHLKLAQDFLHIFLVCGLFSQN